MSIEIVSPTLNDLINRQRLSHPDINKALIINEQSQTGLCSLLVKLGFLSEKELADAYSRILDLPLLTEDAIPKFAMEDNLLSGKFIKESKIVPLGIIEDKYTLAIADPEDNFILKAVSMAVSIPLDLRVATISQIDRIYDQLYGQGKSSMAGIVDEIVPDKSYEEPNSIDKLRELATEAPIIRLVNLIINHALDVRASDIHIEPFEQRLKIRYRIDGVLQDGESPPAHSTAAIVSRIKIMAKMNIAEHRLPQDGRIQIRSQGKTIDFRVSTVPTVHGESLVLRILDKQTIVLDLESLGFDESARIQFNKILNLPHGIILVTGPTGSGKTTTLYAGLQQLNLPGKKILTVEDPVEYQLEGINQIQVKPQIGLTFSHALRSLVRQDPDIIMIGEMRDLETAQIAIQSALTGHLVLSTLHTNDAGSTITRLLDMGIDDYLLTSTLNGVLSQRLVRLLCNLCKTPYLPAPELISELGLDKINNTTEIILYKAQGCKHCANSGYWGRTMISEFLTLSEPIRRLILSHADGKVIQKMAISEGMTDMQHNGLIKALYGLTTLDEVSRVTQNI